MNKKTLTGLSLSLCIKDVIEGKVEENQIDKIISGVLARNSDEWYSVIGQYQGSCWKKDPIKAAKICFRLLEEGKIEQPRLNGGEYPGAKNGHWR